MEKTFEAPIALHDQHELIRRQLSLSSCYALFLDFDGTLTPIVDRPELAFPTESMRETLAKLAAKSHFVVGVISGRQLSDVRDRLATGNIVYAGNHGLEIELSDDAYQDPTALQVRPELETIRDSLARSLAGISGFFLEDKGLSLSVHYRLVPSDQIEKVRQCVHAELARAVHPFQLSLGNMVFDIRPRSHWTKADAVRWIIDRKKLRDPAILFLGDDVTDEDVFVAYPDQVTVRVGRSDATAARFYVESVEEVHEFLKWLGSELN